MYQQTAWSIHETLRLCLELVAEEHWFMNNLLPFQAISPHKIRVFHPKSFEDAEAAINTMKTDDMVLVNVATLESRLAQRLTDYLAGSTLALSGKSTEIGKGVFLLAPPSFSITRMMVTA